MVQILLVILCVIRVFLSFLHLFFLILNMHTYTHTYIPNTHLHCFIHTHIIHTQIDDAILVYHRSCDSDYKYLDMECDLEELIRDSSLTFDK